MLIDKCDGFTHEFILVFLIYLLLDMKCIAVVLFYVIFLKLKSCRFKCIFPIGSGEMMVATTIAREVSICTGREPLFSTGRPTGTRCSVLN